MRLGDLTGAREAVTDAIIYTQQVAGVVQSDLAAMYKYVRLPVSAQARCHKTRGLNANGITNSYISVFFVVGLGPGSTLATITVQAGQMEVAIGHQESAVIVGERTLGLDHPETIRNYVRGPVG